MTKPTRPVNKVVKPMSAKQKANAKRYARFAIGPSAAPAPPSTSWWVGRDREELHEQLALEQPRMSGTKFGRLNTSVE